MGRGMDKKYLGNTTVSPVRPSKETLERLRRLCDKIFSEKTKREDFEPWVPDETDQK